MKFMKLGSRPDTFYTTEAVRAVSSEVSSDLIVQVKGIRYLLHKFHLLSKCLLLQRLCSEIPESKHHQIVQLPDFPGGIEAFELCAKFCYGITITLSAHNIVSARCAAEYLRMTDEAEKGNLIYKIEVFFNSCVLNGWKDSIVTLQSTKSLPSWSEELGITSRCIDAIASKVLANPSRVNLSNSSSRRGRDDISWCNGSESRQHDKPVSKGWWAEDIAELDIDLYWRAMIVIKSVGKPPSSLIGEALRIYVSQWLANISKDSNNANRMKSDSDLVGKMNAKHRLVLETITNLLPPEKGALSCSFLLKLLKVANILNASNCSKMELVRRVGIQLEEAKVSDLFIRSVTNDMVYDVDMVLSILEQFMLQGQSPPTSPPTVKDGLERRRRSGSAEKSEFQESSRSSSASHSSKIKVAKLVDGYVQQVAHDRNLPMSEFIAVAEAVPEFARLDHDGLYRAIDIYLKAHPDLNKSDRKRLCRVLDCKKLSMEARTHVAQNERLPLRVAVQVLTINTDASMLTSSCQPIALPDGGEIVDLDSPEQKPLVDFDATINRAYQSSVLVSNSEKENTRETSKRQCMTESVLSSDDSRTRISWTDLVAPDYKADLVRAYQNGPIMFTLDNKNTREGLNGELLPERTSLAIFSKNTILDFCDDDTGDSEGFDHCTAMLPNVKDEFVDGLSSSCGNECIILSTTNHRDRHDAALLPLVNMDTYIHTASPQPIALPDGGENVLLQSIQQKSLVDFDATNNRDQSSDLVSNSEKKDTREALKGECLNKNALSLHDSTKQNSCPDFDATINKAHLVEAYQNGPVMSLSNENRGDASKRECIGKSILGLEDLRQHFGGRRDDAAKGFGAISDLGFHMTDSLAWTSFEVLETLAPWEQPNGCAPLLSLGRSTLGGCVQQEKSPDLPRIMRIDTVGQRVTKSPRYLEGLTAQSASCSHCPIGLPDRENALLLDPLEQSTKNAAHAAQADLCSPTVSLPKKKMMRKSLKTKCPTMSLVFEDNREHFGRRWEGPAKILRVTPICMKHGINQVSLVNRIHKPHGIHWLPFRQKWERRKGFSLEGERTFEVSSLSMDDILDSRLLFIHMPQFARSSPQTLASPDGGKIVRPIALSSSELAATNNRALHFRRDHSGSITSHYERRNTSETSDRQGIAMSLCSVKDLQHHLVFKHKDTVKRLGVSVPRFKRPYRQHRIYWQPCWIKSNERKAFDATNNRAHLVEADQSGPTVPNLEKETTKEASKRKCITKSVPITEELRQHYGGRQRDAANGLCDSLSRKSLEVLDVLALWEESNTIEHVVPRRRLARQQHWIRPKKSLDLPRTLQMNCPGRLTAQSASSLHWPIGLPAGGHIVFLSKKIRKTFKRECRTISVSFEGHQQHFGSRREGVASSPGGNHICEQHGISLVPKVKRICRQHGIHRSPFRQGNSLGGERPAEVIGVCTEEKLVSRLQFLHMSLLGRSSLCLLALPSGSDCVGHIGFSSSEFTPTNNREHPGRQDWCGSSASRLETERTRETFYREGIASHVFSFEYHQQQFGSKRDNDAKILGVRVSTFKHISRHHGIHRWPNWIKNSVWRRPDPIGEKNPSPTFKKLATNRQITMENDMSGQKHEPNEFLPDSFEDLNFWKKENGSIGEIEKAPTFHDSFSDNCCDADICFSSVYNKTEAEGGSFQWAFRLEGLTTQSTVYPYLPTPVFPQPQIPSTEVLSENMGSFEDRRKLLASQAEDFLEGHVSESSNLTFPACSDAAAPSQLVATILHTVHAISHMIPPLTGGFSETFPLEGQSIQSTAYQNHNALEFPQSQIALTQIPIENMGSSEDWRASQQEPFLEGHVSGSVNSTVPTCSGPSPSQQPMPATPYTMHKIPHMMPPLTYSQDASSVKVKAEYRDTIIEFQLPLASGIIELKEEVAMILKLDLDSFDVKYKVEEGKGDWILMLCDKDLMNYLQLFSSLVNPVIRLLVVDKDSNLTNLDPMALKQPAMFVVSGIDPDNNGIISDLLRFVSKKEIYKKAGKAWTRFYLLYEPPGADRSSLIAAMANYLEFDICDLDLRSMFSIPELKNMLLSTPNRSLIAIQDIDHCDVMLPNLKNELTVSCLLKYVHGLFSRCGDEQIIVFTTNHRDRNDAALLPLVNMDIYIPASSPQPIALPDGGGIVQLESSKQKPLVDFDATNNRECDSVVLVSRSKNNNKREASKRLCMTESVLSVVNPTTGISLTGFDAPNNRAHLVRACQGGPIMSNSEKKDTGEGLKGDFLSRSVLSLDDSTKQKSLLDCDATENKAHLLIAYQSGPVVSLLENRNRGEALERECITKSILGLEDLQQHSGGRRDNAAKSFTAIYDPGIHTTNSLARNSFEVVETLRPWEQPSNATDTEREREIWAQMCLEQSDACGAHSIHVNTYAGRFRAHLFLSLCHSVCIRSIFWELPNDFVPLLSLRRLTLKGCVRKEKSTYLQRLLQIIAVEPGLTISPRYSGGSFAKSGTPLHWSDGLPDGGQVVSPSEKEIVRKTLKRKCRTTKVRRLEYHQLHFESRCQDAAKRHGAKRICRQHMINQVSTVKRIHGQHGIQWWPFRQKWAMMKVYSLEGQRPLEVISLSKGWKFVVRLQVIHVSWLGRSSPGSSAIPGGGREIVGLIALSSSGFAATDNRANLFGQNPSGSTASHSNKKRQRDAAVGKRINSDISEQDLRRHFGLTREEAAKRLGVSVTTLKRRCRYYGIMRWPCNRNGSSDIPGRPPDPNEDFFAELRDLLEIPTNEASGSYEAAIEQQEQITSSFAYRTHNGPVRAQPHMASEEMASENTRSSDLTSQVEAILEGHGSGSNYLTLPTFSNPASSQPMPTISETGPTVSQHISTIPGIVPSQVEARLQAHGSGSSYLTVPTSSNPASTQPMSTIPETGPTIPQPVSTIPVTGPTIPHIMPPLIAQQDMRLVTIKAKYSDSIISFKLPLTSGLTELNEKLAMRLKLRLDSFDVEYRDEEGLWILISCDEDLRDYLQLFSSLDNQVIKLSVLDKVVNANESSGSLKRKRPWEA